MTQLQPTGCNFIWITMLLATNTSEHTHHFNPCQ